MILLLVHAASTLAMVGVIWFVQLVHYPLFRLASERQFERFASAHQRRTSIVVVPLMLVEVVSALALLAWPPAGMGRALLWVGCALLALIWLSTGLIQVPVHRHLRDGRDLSAIRRLVASNWVRTLAWTGRGWVALALLAKVSG